MPSPKKCSEQTTGGTENESRNADTNSKNIWPANIYTASGSVSRCTALAIASLENAGNRFASNATSSGTAMRSPHSAPSMSRKTCV